MQMSTRKWTIHLRHIAQLTRSMIGASTSRNRLTEPRSLRDLTGSQGVIIPADNVPNLMLRDDVIQAVMQGRFHVFAVRTLDDALKLLTGLEAGERGASGDYPAGSLNARVEKRLRGFMEARRMIGSPTHSGTSGAAG